MKAHLAGNPVATSVFPQTFCPTRWHPLKGRRESCLTNGPSSSGAFSLANMQSPVPVSAENLFTPTELRVPTGTPHAASTRLRRNSRTNASIVMASRCKMFCANIQTLNAQISQSTTQMTFCRPFKHSKELRDELIRDTKHISSL